MTSTELTSVSTSAESWDAQFQALKARFARVKESVVFAIHALQTNPEIALEDIKAQATMHGLRVTAASVTAARRLLAPAPPKQLSGIDHSSIDETPAYEPTGNDFAIDEGATEVANVGDAPEDPPAQTTTEQQSDPAPGITPNRRGRKRAQPVTGPDPSSLLLQFVAEIEERGHAEAERLRAAMRSAIEILQAAVDG
jgi:hypothetical protein